MAPSSGGNHFGTGLKEMLLAGNHNGASNNTGIGGQELYSEGGS
jgi:hypothetical protein